LQSIFGPWGGAIHCVVMLACVYSSRSQQHELCQCCCRWWGPDHCGHVVWREEEMFTGLKGVIELESGEATSCRAAAINDDSCL